MTSRFRFFIFTYIYITNSYRISMNQTTETKKIELLEKIKKKDDISCNYLDYTDFKDQDLKNADLSYTDLSYTDLSYANLRHVNLKGTDLTCANLMGSDLRDADLRDADLGGADMRGTYLTRTNMQGLDLRLSMLPADIETSNAYMQNTKKISASAQCSLIQAFLD